MAMNYNKLWKLLIDRNLMKKDLREMAGLSTNVIAKMGKNGDVSRRHFARGRSLGVSLPASEPAVRIAGNIGEHGKRHDVIHFLLVSLEHFLQILAYLSLLRNSFHKPHVAIQTVLRISIVGGSPCFPRTWQRVQ